MTWVLKICLPTFLACSPIAQDTFATESECRLARYNNVIIDQRAPVIAICVKEPKP